MASDRPKPLAPPNPALQGAWKDETARLEKEQRVREAIRKSTKIRSAIYIATKAAQQRPGLLSRAKGVLSKLAGKKGLSIAGTVGAMKHAKKK